MRSIFTVNIISLVLRYARKGNGWCYAEYHWFVLAGCSEVRGQLQLLVWDTEISSWTSTGSLLYTHPSDTIILWPGWRPFRYNMS